MSKQSKQSTRFGTAVLPTPGPLMRFTDDKFAGALHVKTLIGARCASVASIAIVHRRYPDSLYIIPHLRETIWQIIPALRIVTSTPSKTQRRNDARYIDRSGSHQSRQRFKNFCMFPSVGMGAAGIFTGISGGYDWSGRWQVPNIPWVPRSGPYMSRVRLWSIRRRGVPPLSCRRCTRWSGTASWDFWR